MQIDDSGTWKGIFVDSTGKVSVAEGRSSLFDMGNMINHPNQGSTLTWIHQGTDASDPYAFSVYAFHSGPGNAIGLLTNKYSDKSENRWAHNRYVITDEGGFWLVP